MGEPRDPIAILADFDDGCRGLRDIDMRQVLMEVIDDVRHSFKLAILDHYPDAERESEIQDEVRDYVLNHYGDQ